MYVPREVAVPESEDRYKLAVDAARLPVWEYDVATNTVTGNVYWHRTLGRELTEEQVRQHAETWLSDIHPDDYARFERVFSGEAADSTGFYETEFRIRTASGAYKWLLERGRVVARDVSGAARKVAGICVDVDARKRAEEALRESELRLRTVVSGSDIGLWDWSLQSNEMFWSAICKRQIGYQDHELSNAADEWRSRIHPEDGERVLGNVGALVAGGGPDLEAEFRFRHKDGSYRRILARASLLTDERGRPRRIIGSHVDVTERWAAEARLRESELRLRSVIDASPVPFALNDERGDITFLNPAFVRTFGYSNHDIPTLTDWWARAYPDPAYRRWVQETWRSRREDASRRNSAFEPMEVLIRCKDGSERTVVADAIPLAGASAGTHLVVLLDVTEQRHLEKAVLTAASREQHRLGMDLHDGLGQQLTGLSLMLTALAHSSAAREVPAIGAELATLATLASDSVATARAIAHGLSPVELGGGGFRRALRRLAGSTARLSGLKIAVRTTGFNDADLDQSVAEPVFRIAQEALTNAVKHAGATQARIEVHLADGALTLTVSDDGRGLADARRSAGVGLSIMSYRARALGGRIEIDSPPTGGTVVRCSCPAATGGSR
jgi:PAS domain S-box-containing protein